jgi:hypothetical protein
MSIISISCFVSTAGGKINNSDSHSPDQQRGRSVRGGGLAWEGGGMAGEEKGEVWRGVGRKRSRFDFTISRTAWSAIGI